MARFYAACLASYNNGILHGAWIDASTDVDEMQDAINAMLRASRFPNVTVEHDGKRVPSAEEWAMHDKDGDELDGLGEYCGLQAIANRIELAELAESELGDDGMEIVNAFYDRWGQCDDAPADMIERVRDAYQGTFRDLEAWADDYWESSGMYDGIPEHARAYVDVERWARDAEMGGDIFTADVSGGLAIFSNH